MSPSNGEALRSKLLEIDEARFRNRATAGRMPALGSPAPARTTTPARDVDGIDAALESFQADVAQVLYGHEEDVRALRAELTDTKERLAHVERLLAESWGQKR